MIKKKKGPDFIGAFFLLCAALTLAGYFTTRLCNISDIYPIIAVVHTGFSI
jgi:hypothetical protein